MDKSVGETGAEILIGSLAAEGVETIFGLPGLQLDYSFDALYGRRDTIRVIHTRHEQATAYMAFGYAQASGRVGTCLVVPGPGVLNTTAALSTAYACNAPVLCITGQIPSAHIGGGLGFLHEIPNQDVMLASVTKWQARITSPADAPAIVHEAFHHLNSGRRGPVVIEIPPDVAAAHSPVLPAPQYAPEPAKPVPDPDAIAHVPPLCSDRRATPRSSSAAACVRRRRKRIARACRNVAGAGHHERGMGSARSISVIRSRKPCRSATTCGRVSTLPLRSAPDFFHPIVEWGRDDGIRLIRIDLDPTQSVAAWLPDVHIVADARAALSDLVDRVPRANRQRQNRLAEFAGIKAAKEEQLGRILAPQRAYTQVIRDALPEDGIVCFDVTQLHFYSWWGYPTYQARTVIQPGYQGTLGYGYPTALGAKVALPHRPVVYVGGDGGFMFNCQELSTAMRFGIGVVAVVFNDQAYGNVRRGQKELFGGRLIASDLHNPDFAKFVESFGMEYYKADSPQTLAPALRTALEAGRPAFIEVTIDAFPNPFPHMFFRKVRG